jgi:hypothetical protein
MISSGHRHRHRRRDAAPRPATSSVMVENVVNKKMVDEVGFRAL